MTERTHTPTAEVDAMLQALAMPQCECWDQTPCFRITAGDHETICWPCQSGNHAHGYAGTLQQMPLDSLRTTAAPPALPITPTEPDERPTMALCTVCGQRPTWYGVCGRCNQAAVQAREEAATALPSLRPRDGVFDGAGE